MEDTVGVVPSASQHAFVAAFLDRLFDPVFSLYIFSTVFLPGGSIYGINVKFPMYLMLLPLALRKFLQQNPRSVAMLALLLAIPALLSFWVLEGVIYGFAVSGAIRQYTDIVLVILICWLSFLFCEGRESGRLRFLRLVLNSEIATCLFKVGIILYATVLGIPVFTVVTNVSHAFGVELMTMDLGALFGRVQFVSDAIIPICIFMVVRHRDRLKLGNIRALVTITLLLLSVAFSFSRYFWGYTAIAFAIGLFLGKRDRFKAILIAAIAVIVLASLPLLSSLYELRYSDAVAGASDELRAGQSQALQHFFLDAPILGHGFGSYTTQLVRSVEGRQSYEMQLLALAGQTGIAGMTLFLLLLAWYYRRIVLNRSLSVPDRLGLGILLIVWLAAGLYNPLLETPVASVTYASLAALSGLTREEPHRLATSRPA